MSLLLRKICNPPLVLTLLKDAKKLGNVKKI